MKIELGAAMEAVLESNVNSIPGGESTIDQCQLGEQISAVILKGDVECQSI